MANTKVKTGAVGFCMSGPLVLALAQSMPEKIGAVASVHGASFDANSSIVDASGMIPPHPPIWLKNYISATSLSRFW